MPRNPRLLIAALATIALVAGCGTSSGPDDGGSILPPPPNTGPLLPFRVGSFGQDFAKGVGNDASGNGYVVSSFEGTVDFDPSSAANAKISFGGSDIALAKYRTDGSLAWVVQMGGGGADTPYDVKVGSNGAVYFVGYASAGALCSGQVVRNNGGRDAVIARVSAFGVCEWALGIGGTGDDEARSLVVEPNGDIVVTGTFRGTVDFDQGGGTGILVSRGLSDVFVARYSSSGTFKQVAQFGGADEDAGFALARTSDGDIVAGGEFRGIATFGSALAPVILGSVGESDFFLARLAPSLGVQWAIRGGGPGADAVGTDGIIVAPNGTLIVSGNFSGVADFDPSPGSVLLQSQGLSDVFVVRYDGSGVWSGLALRYGGPDNDWVQGSTRDAVGNMYFAGWFQGTVDFDPSGEAHVVESLGKAGASDGYLLSLGPEGEFRWVSPVGAAVGGAANFTITSGVSSSADGAIWAAGRFFGLADLDPGTEAVQVQSLGDADQFVVRYSAATGGLRR